MNGKEVYIKRNCPDTKWHDYDGTIISRRGNMITVYIEYKFAGRNYPKAIEFHKSYVAIKGIDYI